MKEKRIHKKIVINDTIRSKKELMDFFSEKLHFPEYFGRNWDALFDCLSDLGWLESTTVVIEHESFPKLNRQELTIYKKLLDDLIKKNKTEHSGKLEINFPKDPRI